MADQILASRSALAGSPASSRGFRFAAVTLAERKGLDLVSVAARRGCEAALALAVRDAFGLDLPRTPRRVGGGDLAILWAGDGRWIAASATRDLEAALTAKLGHAAVVVGQGDGRVALRVAGPSARNLLAKAVTLDLHPRAFRTDDVALAPAFGIPVQLCQVDDAPTFEIYAPRSYAATLFAWLAAAGEEFGVAVGGTAGHR